MTPQEWNVNNVKIIFDKQRTIYKTLFKITFSIILDLILSSSANNHKVNDIYLSKDFLVKELSHKQCLFLLRTS